MKIISTCPYCNKSFYLEHHWADKRYKCQQCLQTIKVPPLSDLEKPMQIIENAHTEVYVDEDGNIYG